MFKFKIRNLGLLAIGGIACASLTVGSNEADRFWIKVHATNSVERTAIANTGVSIEAVRDEYVVAIGSQSDLDRLQRTGKVETFYPLQQPTNALDFPSEDSAYHNYTEVLADLNTLLQENTDVTESIVLGRTVEGREIRGIRISTDLRNASSKPGIFYVGGHHAREHLSVEMPLRFAQNFLREYRNGNPRIVRLVQTRDIHIIPALNADGLEYDIASGRYQYWRKNRRNNGGSSYGVDLNRNYGYQWGTGGSSKNPGSETFMGPTPFSEPETVAVKNYLETHRNITTVLSFHTFSELILYPWGHTDAPISEMRDRQVHEVMARKMATWNGYTPQKTSELYIASGDLTDWAYGTLKMITFTFELDPADQWSSGGFYPGAAIIDSVVQKNTEPALYLMEYADNPYRVLETNPYRPM